MAKRDLYPVGIWAGVLLLHVAVIAAGIRWGASALVSPPEIQWVQALAIDPPASAGVTPAPLKSTRAPAAALGPVKDLPPVSRTEAKPDAVAIQAAPQPASQPAPMAEAHAEARSVQGRSEPKAMQPASVAPSPTRTSGADLTPPSQSASYLSNPPPPYPAISKRLGEQGRVVVRVYIDESGQPKEAQLEIKSGYSRLDNAALEAVMSWRYVPAKRGGVPLAMWFNVPVTFDLKSNRE